MNRSRWKHTLVLGAVLVGAGPAGCGNSTPETGGAGSPGHRGPATQNIKKQPVRQALPPGAERGTK